MSTSELFKGQCFKTDFTRNENTYLLPQTMAAGGWLPLDNSAVD